MIQMYNQKIYIKLRKYETERRTFLDLFSHYALGQLTFRF